jgi:dihydrofolate reductase
MREAREVIVRKVRYSVAASLDGYIAGPQGEADWIVIDPDFDFAAIYQEFDTVLLGRKTFEVVGGGGDPGMKTYVFSRTLRPQDHPGVTVVADKAEETVAALRAGKGKDIWLFGGGLLFRSLARAGLVDRVEVGVMPVLLGGGIPLLPPPADQVKLKLVGHQVYKSGSVGLEYAVQ